MGRHARELGYDPAVGVDEGDVADRFVPGGLLAYEHATEVSLGQTRVVDPKTVHAGRERGAAKRMLRPEESELQAAVKQSRVGLPVLTLPTKGGRADELRGDAVLRETLELPNHLELGTVKEDASVDLIAVCLERVDRGHDATGLGRRGRE